MAKFRNVTGETVRVSYGMFPPGTWVYVKPDATIIVRDEKDADAYRGQDEIWAEELDTAPAPTAPAAPAPAAAPEHEEPTP
jgi:hypothetical protein